MRVNVVRIGNSRGLRIPKALLDQCGIDDVVDLTVTNGHLVVSPLRRTRDGWSEAAQQMAARGDDAVLDPETQTRFDAAEWDW
jgi:antitoxin MazE